MTKSTTELRDEFAKLALGIGLDLTRSHEGTYRFASTRCAWLAYQAGRSAAQGEQSKYAELEREHLGDPDKRTGIYHPDVIATSQAGSAEQVSERPQLVAKPLEDYSSADQAFYRFWYGHMQNDQMTGALANVDHSTARYIWDAALTTQVEQATERMAFETWIKSIGGSVDWVGDGEYRSAPTECAWTAWLARAALCAPERKVMTDEAIEQLAKRFYNERHEAFDVRGFARAILNQQGEQTAPWRTHTHSCLFTVQSTAQNR